MHKLLRFLAKLPLLARLVSIPLAVLVAIGWARSTDHGTEVSQWVWLAAAIAMMGMAMLLATYTLR